MSQRSYRRGAARGNRVGDRQWARATLDAAAAWLAAHGEAARNPGPRMRSAGVTITVGRGDGRLGVHHFASAAEAHAAGFTWAGR